MAGLQQKKTTWSHALCDRTVLCRAGCSCADIICRGRYNAEVALMDPRGLHNPEVQLQQASACIMFSSAALHCMPRLQGTHAQCFGCRCSTHHPGPLTLQRPHGESSQSLTHIWLTIIDDHAPLAVACILPVNVHPLGLNVIGRNLPLVMPACDARTSQSAGSASQRRVPVLDPASCSVIVTPPAWCDLLQGGVCSRRWPQQWTEQ